MPRAALISCGGERPSGAQAPSGPGGSCMGSCGAAQAGAGSGGVVRAAADAVASEASTGWISSLTCGFLSQEDSTEAASRGRLRLLTRSQRMERRKTEMRHGETSANKSKKCKRAFRSFAKTGLHGRGCVFEVLDAS